MSEAPKIFLVRGGKLGEDEEIALDSRLAIIGFDAVPSLEQAKDYDTVHRLVKANRPDASTRVMAIHAGELRLRRRDAGG